MMPRKYQYPLIAALLLLVGGTFYYYYFKPAGTFNNEGYLLAIPAESPLVVQINDPVEQYRQLQRNEQWLTLKSIPALNRELEKVDTLMSRVQRDALMLKLLKGKTMLLAFNISGKNDVSLLSIVRMKDKSDLSLADELLQQFKSDPAFQLTSRKYNKSNIHEITIAPNEQLYLANENGLLIFSQKSIFVEEALRQINNDLTQQHPELMPLLKTIGSKSAIHLFVNHQYIHQLLAQLLSTPMKNRSSLQKIFTSWTELDLNIKDESMLISGFSNGNNEGNYYGNLLLNQQASHFKSDRVLPQSATDYLSLSLSSPDKFFKDYEAFLGKRNLLLKRTDQLKKIENITKVNLQALLVDIMKNEITSAGIGNEHGQNTNGRIWVVECKSGSSAIQQLADFQTAYVSAMKLNQSDWKRNYSIDQQTSFTLYRFPVPDMPRLLFGNIFNGTASNWVAQYNNYLIFGDHYATVSKVLLANVLGETLDGSLDYNKDKANFNTRSNLRFYCNTVNALPFASDFFNQTLASDLAGNESLRKFKSFSWQIAAASPMLYNNASLTFSSTLQSKPQTIWKSHIKSNFDFKPKFVVNHLDPGNKEVVLQDNEHNIYLISNLGRILWQQKLDGPILGEIQQIDYFKNGKLQYLFNTASKLYLVDREGNSVKNFPINFRSKATNPVSVFDYENNRDYRFFVAGEDQLIYAYSPDGNLLKGWNQFKTDHPVKHPVQHFRIDGKDFIVVSDLMKNYLLHRTGDIRVQADQIYPHSPNNTIYLEDRSKTHEPRLVSTEQDGTLHYIYFDGKHETVKLSDFSKQHFFRAANIDNDDECEYLFADGKQFSVLKSNGQTIFSIEMEKAISHLPHVYSFSKQSRKIGITVKDANKIYLYSSSGEMHPGFPLDGCTAFSIGFISAENTHFNLLVGSPDGYLCNYFVE
ncbi:MAG: hypothetical protein JXR22_03320 [Prolixibacteraceae bacterium]|nr:hypothetical protein [Prolixibacteraceae bacterium]